MTTVPPVEADDSRSAVAGTADAQPRAVTTNRIYERVRSVYLTADLRSLALGRIVLALVLLRDLVGRWMELGIWYTNDGIIPNHSLLWRPPWDHVFSLFYLASYRYEAVVGFVICLGAYTALLLGFRTKLAQIAATVCMIRSSTPSTPATRPEPAGATAARSTTRFISTDSRPGSRSGCGTTCRRRWRAG